MCRISLSNADNPQRQLHGRGVQILDPENEVCARLCSIQMVG